MAVRATIRILPAVDVSLHPFPSADRAFVDHVKASFDHLPADGRTPEELQRAVRRRYPAAVVKAQEELARRGNEPLVWYVYRSGSIGLPGDPVPSGSWPAWAVLDRDRRFVAVSDAFAEIAEIPAAAMIGRPLEEFSNPDDPTVREDLRGLWAEFRRTGRLDSTIRFNHADGREREIEYHLVADDPEPGRHRLSIREVGATA